MEKLILKVLAGHPSDKTPIWLMRQAGRYLPEYKEVRKKAGKFLNLCFNPELAAEVTLQPIRRFGFDAAIIFSDILVIPYSLGLDLDYLEGEGPKLSQIKSNKDIINLKKGRVKKELSPVYEALSLVKKELPKNTALIGFAGAPWTVSTYMIEGGSSREFKLVKQVIKEDRKSFLTLIEILVEETIEYLSFQIEAGAEIIQIFDSWAKAVEEKDLQEFIYTPTKKIVDAINRKHPNIPIIGFPKGIKNIKEFVDKTGVNAVSIEDSQNILSISKSLNGIPVQGNLSNEILANGTKEEVISATQNILNSMQGRAHIFNLGHGILPHTPIENVEVMLDEIRNFGRAGIK